MKVNDIRSFFQKPGSSSKSSSSSASTAEPVVQVPSRLKKGGNKGKSKKEDPLNVNIENSEESDGEDPLPKKAQKGSRDSKQVSGRSGGRSRKPVIDDDDSDDEDPIPKSGRNRKAEFDKKEKSSQEKKRKARVLSDSDDDDFQAAKTKEKPVTKQAKVEKKVEILKKKKEDLKPVNPADFFSSAPIKRETKEKKETEARSTPSKKEDKKETKTSPNKPSLASTSPKSKSHNGNGERSPQRIPTSLIEPKKLKMETPTPEKRQAAKPNEPGATSFDRKPETKLNKTPIKQESKFKVPTPPVTTEKSKPRTDRAASKRQATADDDDEENDFDPKQKASSSGSKAKQDKQSRKKDDKTPAPSDTDEEEKEAKSVSTPKQNYMKYLAKLSMKPKNLGSKEVPEGAPNCLQGLTFVISGVLDSLERDDCKDLVVKYGGRVTGSVSGKTSYVIVGDEPGESKIKKALQLKVPQLNEDELLAMIRKSNPNGQSQDSGLAYSEDLGGDSEQMKVESDYDPDVSLFDSPVAKKGLTPKKKLELSKLAKEESPRKKVKTEDLKPQLSTKKVVTNLNSQPSTSKVPAVVPVAAEAELMWVDKYKPKSLKNVVGQVSDTSNAKKLVRWLTNWFKYHGSSQDKVKASWPGLKDPEGKSFKAALLSGPPGVGKTTTAHLAVKEVGYDYFELNASDTRNKRGLHENVADALSSKSLVFGKKEEMTRLHVLIMDEVDGMSGNEDRGGVQELIALIKSSRVPVICICNDRNHTKIRSLSSYCFDLRFNKPSFEQLKAFIMSICFKEKIKIPQEKVQQLIISTDNDVRQILHQLELFKEGKSEGAYNPRKDLRFGPWDVARKVFLKSERDKMSIHDKNGLFFQDYNIGPLFVQENYIRWNPAAARGNRYKHLDLISKAASSIADGDLVETTIRRTQTWGLLPVQAVFASYMPGEFMESNSMGGVDFPAWLGKNSNKNKRHRLLQSLHTHLHLQVSGSLEALNMDYLPYLRRAITQPLISGDHESASQVMEDYTLLRDDVESINDLSIWPGSKDPMEKVDSKVKAAFTRQVNKEILPYSSANPVKSKGRGGGGHEDDLEALLEEQEGGGEVVGEEEDDSIEKDAMVKMKTRKGGSSKTTTASTSKGKGRKAKKDLDDDDGEKDAEPSKGKGSKSSKQPSGKSRKGK